jgi:hypothetical protein
MLFLSFFIVVGLACSFSTTPDPTATPFVVTATPEPEQDVVEPAPTNTQIVVQQPDPTEEEDDEPVSNDPPAYFIEDFDSGLDSWSYFMMNGDENLMDLYTENSRLIFDLQGTYQWVYVLYDEYTYDSVRLDLYAENRGKNSNNVSMICNYSDRDGWYEFNITNGGLYDILVYSEMDGDYYALQSGGSTNINMGRASNVYSAICDGNYLALYINGVLEKEVVDNKYNLREGQVGFGVSSFDVTPILVEVDAFSIDIP